VPDSYTVCATPVRDGGEKKKSISREPALVYARKSRIEETSPKGMARDSSAMLISENERWDVYTFCSTAPNQQGRYFTTIKYCQRKLARKRTQIA
jgi:hypothetical protein